MSNSPQNPIRVSPQAETSRKAYHTPRMEDYGEVRELTRTAPTAPYYGDGGTFPAVYSSIPN